MVSPSGRRMRHEFGADGAAGAAAIVDDDIGLQLRRQLRREQARQLIDRAAGGERHDDFDGFGEEPALPQRECEQRRTAAQARKRACESVPSLCPSAAVSAASYCAVASSRCY